MSRRTLAATGLVATLAATSGVALAVHAHGGSAHVAITTSGSGTRAAAGAKSRYDAVSLANATTAAPAAAAPAHGTVGAFHFSTNDFKIDSNQPTEVVMPTFTLHAGASNKWHTHPGPGFILVTSGTLTLYQVIDNACVKSTYGPGQAFVEAPGVVHIARNEGTSGDVTGIAAFLDVTPGTATFRTSVPAPAACPGIN